jgi:hypothetical protein
MGTVIGSVLAHSESAIAFVPPAKPTVGTIKTDGSECDLPAKVGGALSAQTEFFPGPEDKPGSPFHRTGWLKPVNDAEVMPKGHLEKMEMIREIIEA